MRGSSAFILRAMLLVTRAAGGDSLAAAPAETSTAIFHAPRVRNSSMLVQLVDRYLTKDDLRAFKAATGTSVSRLLQLISTAVSAGDKCDFIAPWEGTADLLTAIMGTDKVVHHQLNRHGLHPLRALLSERILDHMRRLRSAEKHELYDRLLSDGIVVIPHVDKLLNTSVEKLYTARDGYVAHLFEAISGYGRPCCGTGGNAAQQGKGASLTWPRGNVFSSVRPFLFHAHDTQIYMHVDTYNPTWKVWVFAHTTLREGPFHFVYGSHRNTEGRLRWLYDRTFNSSGARGGKSLKKRKLNHGPFRDETHGWQDSIRFVGFDPAAPVNKTSAADLRRYGFAQPTPIVTPPRGLTLVVADTSALHYRGVPQRGVAARWASRLNSYGGGCGYCIPRKNPFFCGLNPEAC